MCVVLPWRRFLVLVGSCGALCCKSGPLRRLGRRGGLQTELTPPQREVGLTPLQVPARTRVGPKGTCAAESPGRIRFADASTAASGSIPSSIPRSDSTVYLHDILRLHKRGEVMLSTGSADSVAAPPTAVLLVSADAEDHAELPGIFRGSPWELQGAWTSRDGLKLIRRNRGQIPVVICAHSLPDGDWKLLLAEFDTMAVRPSLIVSSRLADDRLWVEVLHLGAFDLLLGAPFEPEEVLRVTESAWLAWNRAPRPTALPRIGPERARSLGAAAQGRPLRTAASDFST